MNLMLYIYLTLVLYFTTMINVYFVHSKLNSILFYLKRLNKRKGHPYLALILPL